MHEKKNCVEETQRHSVVIAPKKPIVKLGNHCELKLEKATKVLFIGFFHAICLRMCPMARAALKHKHMASKFNPGLKRMKKSLHNDYLLKKLFAAHFFSVIAH